LKKYLKYFAEKQGLRVVTIVILVLLGVALFLGVLSGREIKKMIKKDFNHQQLALARHMAGTLENNLKVVKRELITLSLSPSIQYVEAVSWPNRMKISLSSISDYGAIRIMLVSADGANSYSINYANAIFMEEKNYAEEDYFKWCKKPENKTRIYISKVNKGIVADSDPGLIMTMAMPVYQVSSDEAHPVPTYKFAGVLVFVLDAGSLARRLAAPIRSGKTGYAWIIDEDGKFLYHLEKDFVGENAFEVRKFKDPHISFKRINLIQKTKMLHEDEGIAEYISGWHRGVKRTMNKLIAYAPVHIGAANAIRSWSVAVVAPTSEVEGAIHAVYVRQSIIQGAFVVAVLVIFAFLVINERSWLKTLEQEVNVKTKDLAMYAERLKRSEERYRSVIESADDMIFTIDMSCTILSVNKYCTELVGRNPGAIVGENLMDLFEYEHPNEVCALVERVFAVSETISHEESVTIGKRHYCLDTKYKPLFRTGSNKDAILCISRDITEHKKIEDQLSHTERLASLGSLSAGVAHEINNPIAVILGFTELLLEKLPEDSKEYEMLKTIERQGNNCKKIVENLLAFGKVRGKTPGETDAIEDLQRVINVTMNTMVTKKVDLTTHLEEDLPNVCGDGQQLEQVYLNIINNALAAMDGGGILTISANHVGDMVSVSFADTGYGIAKDNMDKIFEPFFTTKKVGEGTGLGLSVSYAIVKKCGGDIQVESQTKEEGKVPGTTFTLLLPMAGENISQQPQTT